MSAVSVCTSVVQLGHQSANGECDDEGGTYTSLGLVLLISLETRILAREGNINPKVKTPVRRRYMTTSNTNKKRYSA